MYKFDENMYIECLPAVVYKQLTTELNDNSCWKTLADNVSELLEIRG